MELGCEMFLFSWALAFNCTITARKPISNNAMGNLSFFIFHNWLIHLVYFNLNFYLILFDFTTTPPLEITMHFFYSFCSCTSLFWFYFLWHWSRMIELERRYRSLYLAGHGIASLCWVLLLLSLILTDRGYDCLYVYSSVGSFMGWGLWTL